MRTLSLSLSLILLLPIVPGCNPSVREIMEETFAEDPPVIAEYQPDGSRILKTRNMVLDARYMGDALSSLVMLVALPGDSLSRRADEQGGLIKFRSVAPQFRFSAERSLLLQWNGVQRDLGRCEYQAEERRQGRITEDLSIVVPRQLVQALAQSDTLSGLVGGIPFTLTHEQLAPVRALADTAGAR